MNRISIIFCAAVFPALLIGACGCGDKSSPTVPTSGPTGASKGGPSAELPSGSGELPAGWVKVKISEGPCEVVMPGQPTRSETVKDWGGTSYVYGFKDNKDIVYVVSLSSVPTDEEWAARESTFNLKGARDEVFKTLKDTPIAEKAIDYQGHLGFEIVGRDRESELFVRVRHFQIAVQKHPQTFNVVMMSRKQEDLTSKDADEFFQSFRVLKDIATRPSPTAPKVTSPAKAPTSLTPLSADGSLFNGNDLSGWVGQSGVWKVQDGAIVGSSFPTGRKENTFLSTEREFRDFELDFDVKLTGNNNSGVMVRSKLVDTDKYWTSGIKIDLGGKQAGWGGLVTYDGRNGRILKPAGRVSTATVKADDFNHVHIKCVGKHIVVTVNGTQVQDTELPELESSGVISFHLRYGNPTSIAIRNVRVREVP